MKNNYFTLEQAEIFYKNGYAVIVKNGEIFLEKER